MTSLFPLKKIQTCLKRDSLDGWLFYYFQKNDPITERLLLRDNKKLFTRRWFYYVPTKGSPKKLIHRIESHSLRHLPGKALFYASWKELENSLAKLLKRSRKVAMQYSPKNAVPTISRVDAGTIELVKSLGIVVVSSGDLVQALEAPLTLDQWKQHQKTATQLRECVFKAFLFIKNKIEKNKKITEWDVQQEIVKHFQNYKLISNSPPIVAVNKNSGKPHYIPTKKNNSVIRKDDWVLLDIWAKPKKDHSIYGDITWCGFVGKKVPSRFTKIFDIVRLSRDAALDRIKEKIEKKKQNIMGWEVDRVTRSYIEKKGYGPSFIHRTGHSIGEEDHANGANMDGWETFETRRLFPKTLFSIEPGIYLKDFGVRSEINVYIDGNKVRVSGEPIQKEVIPILGLPS